MGIEAEVTSEVMKIALEGAQYTIKAGAGTLKGIGVALYALIKKVESGKTLSPGEHKIKSIIQNDTGPVIFTLNRSDILEFSKRAKEYGIPFAVIGWDDTKDHLSTLDIMVPNANVQAVNHVLQTFKIDAVRNDLEVSRDATPEEIKAEEEKAASEITVADEFDVKGVEDDLPPEEAPQKAEQNPKENQSEKSSTGAVKEQKDQNPQTRSVKEKYDGKHSIIDELKTITASQKKSKDDTTKEVKTIIKDTKDMGKF